MSNGNDNEMYLCQLCGFPLDSGTLAVECRLAFRKEKSYVDLVEREGLFVDKDGVVERHFIPKHKNCGGEFRVKKSSSGDTTVSLSTEEIVE